MTYKTLANSDVNGARKNVPDIEVFGNGDMWLLLSKASSQVEGWMKSTKATQVPDGCLVQVTTQQRNPDGSYAVAEAVTYIPGDIWIIPTLKDGEVVGRYLGTRDEYINHPDHKFFSVARGG